MTLPAVKKPNTTVFSTAAGTVAPAAALTTNWQAGDVLDLGKYHNAAVQIFYDADGSGTSNKCNVIIMVSNAATQPLATDDEWVAVSQQDVSPTDGALTGSFPASVDVTATPNWGKVVTRGLYWESVAASAGTDKLREPIIVNVIPWRWMFVMAREGGDTDVGDTGALTVKVGLSAV